MITVSTWCRGSTEPLSIEQVYGKGVLRGGQATHGKGDPRQSRAACLSAVALESRGEGGVANSADGQFVVQLSNCF